MFSFFSYINDVADTSYLISIPGSFLLIFFFMLYILHFLHFLNFSSILQIPGCILLSSVFTRVALEGDKKKTAL